jgi:hypothetical protein
MFIELNSNPINARVGDCVIRAIAAAEINELMQYAENETERSVLRQAAEMLKNNAEK